MFTHPHPRKGRTTFITAVGDGTTMSLHKIFPNILVIHSFPPVFIFLQLSIPRIPYLFSFVLSLLHDLLSFAKTVYKLPKFNCFYRSLFLFYEGSVHRKVKILTPNKMCMPFLL